MIDLSPAAKAVAWAYDNTPEKETGNHRYHWLAAALRAAADQVVPALDPDDPGPVLIDAERNRARRQLLSIANELESASAE